MSSADTRYSLFISSDSYNDYHPQNIRLNSLANAFLSCDAIPVLICPNSSLESISPFAKCIFPRRPLKTISSSFYFKKYFHSFRHLLLPLLRIEAKLSFVLLPLIYLLYRSDSISIIYLSSNSVLLSSLALLSARLRGIHTVVDVGEWPDGSSSSFIVSSNFLTLLRHRTNIFVCALLADYIICITTQIVKLLADLYPNCRTFLIPAVTPAISIPPLTEDAEYLSPSHNLKASITSLCGPHKKILLYLGSLKKEDCFTDIIECFREYSDLRSKFILLTAGYYSKSLLLSLTVPTDYISYGADGFIYDAGLLDTSTLYDTIKISDACILLRDNSVSSKASFPTRLPLFLHLKKVVICNNTGDISHYLTPGTHYIHCNSFSSFHIQQAFLELDRLDPQQLRTIEDSSHARAQECFNPSGYVKSLLLLLSPQT